MTLSEGLVPRPRSNERGARAHPGPASRSAGIVGWWVATNLVLVAGVGCGAPGPAPAQPVVIENVAPPVRNREAVTWEADERHWMALVLKDLRQSGERAGHSRLLDLVNRTEIMLDRADRGELTLEQLLVAFRQAEDGMTDPVGDAVTQQLDDLRAALRHGRRVPRPD